MRQRLNFLPAALACALALAGCGVEPAPGELRSPVIYGHDDRLDVWQLRGQQALLGATPSVAVMIRAERVQCSGGSCTLEAQPYAAASAFQPQGLCTDEPFYDQERVRGFCSAFLVGPDLLATAGHCVQSSKDCKTTRVVFGFQKASQPQPAPTVVPAGDVYGCADIVANVRHQNGGADYAVIRLDRPVTGRQPLCVRRGGAMPVGTPLVLMGHPYTLPLKVAGGAQVRSTGAEVFMANLDAFGGNSGSPVFDATTLSVAGILVRGNADYVLDGTCWRSHVCSDATGCPTFEESTQVTQAAPSIPMTSCYAP